MSRVRGSWPGLGQGIEARAVFPNSRPDYKALLNACEQLRDSPCPAFPSADPPRLITPPVPALSKQLTMTPSPPAAPLLAAAGTQHILASAHAETPGKTTHDINPQADEPASPWVPSCRSGGTRHWAKCWRRKEICLPLRLSPGGGPATPRRCPLQAVTQPVDLGRSGVLLLAVGFAHPLQLSLLYKYINKRSVCRRSLL